MPKIVTFVSLATSQQDFDKLHHQVAANRSDVGSTWVDKKALMHLLYDHSQLVGVIEDDAAHIDVRLEHGDREAQEESLLALKQYRDIKIENQIDLKQEIVIHNNTDSDVSIQNTDGDIEITVAELTDNDKKDQA